MHMRNETLKPFLNRGGLFNDCFFDNTPASKANVVFFVSVIYHYGHTVLGLSYCLVDGPLWIWITEAFKVL